MDPNGKSSNEVSGLRSVPFEYEDLGVEMVAGIKVLEEYTNLMMVLHGFTIPGVKSTLQVENIPEVKDLRIKVPNEVLSQ